MDQVDPPARVRFDERIETVNRATANGAMPTLTRRGLLGRLAAAGPLAWIISACGGGESPAPAPTLPPDGAGMPGQAPGGVAVAPDAAGEGAGTASSDVASTADVESTSDVEPLSDVDSTADVEPSSDVESAAETVADADAPTLDPTPACPDDDDPTPPQTEGPFYTPDTPERASLLEAGITGTTLVVTGRVLDTSCRPIAGALLDFWHADADGVYDNVGYRLRGHQFAAADGAWRLETILPAVYPGRTRHIHVRVQPPGGAVLTTQLYFPGEAANARDGIYQPELELTMAPDGADGSRSGTFDFVLAAPA